MYLRPETKKQPRGDSSAPRATPRVPEQGRASHGPSLAWLPGFLVTWGGARGCTPATHLEARAEFLVPGFSPARDHCQPWGWEVGKGHRENHRNDTLSTCRHSGGPSQRAGPQGTAHAGPAHAGTAHAGTAHAGTAHAGTAHLPSLTCCYSLSD